MPDYEDLELRVDPEDPPDTEASPRAIVIALLALTVAVALVFIANRYAEGAS